jgi:MOSC domain-containing protein YiiM
MAAIYSIVYKPAPPPDEDRTGDYLRAPLQEATLVEGVGIQGDHKGGKHPDRQLNLLSREWLEAAALKGYKTEPGQFGEQLVISGIAVETLAPGARLQLGDQAMLEIVKPRTGCARLQAAQGHEVLELGKLGVLARVVSGGQVRVGDAVKVLETVG